MFRRRLSRRGSAVQPHKITLDASTSVPVKPLVQHRGDCRHSRYAAKKERCFFLGGDQVFAPHKHGSADRHGTCGSSIAFGVYRRRCLQSWKYARRRLLSSIERKFCRQHLQNLYSNNFLLWPIPPIASRCCGWPTCGCYPSTVITFASSTKPRCYEAAGACGS